MPKRMGERLKGGLGGYGILIPTGHESGSCRWEGMAKARWNRYANEAAGELAEDADDDAAGLEEELLEQTGEVAIYFRDPSGYVLPSAFWYPAKTFWSVVKAKSWAAMKVAT